MVKMNKINDFGKIYHQPSHLPRAVPGPGKDRLQAVAPVDRVSLSKQALEASHRNRKDMGATAEPDLTPEEKEAVNKLKQRDAAVKAHEQAHLSAGAGVARGGASYAYQTGPDGRMYAVGGEVQIDLSGAGSPEATIRKMQQVQAAALAPAQPSGTDRAVAAQAAQIEAQARMEKAEAKKEETSGTAGANARQVDTDRPAPVAPRPSHAGGGIDLMA